VFGRHPSDRCEEILVPVLERLLDPLVQLLVAPRGLRCVEVTSSKYGRVLGLEVEGRVDLVDTADIKVLSGQTC
jgi:hypothetical protein